MDIYATMTSTHYREFARFYWRYAADLAKAEGFTDRVMRLRSLAGRYDWLADAQEKKEEEARKKWGTPDDRQRND